MDLTARWHRSNCRNPSVVVEDGVPRCHSCDATSSVLADRLVKENSDKGGVIELPVDTPLGEVDLWWPPSVPYRSPQVDTKMDSEPCGDEKDATILSKNDTESSSATPIYHRSLDSSHFRLIYITGSEDISSPIHIRVEEYALDDRPEYEAVSYVWGGEEGDSTPCKPVYVGKFWDIMLATSNCSALLHYLRPRTICRVIWLDAICINQFDNEEKPAQISRMGDIYTNCERVVAFFGGDLVRRPRGRSFRPRIYFPKPILTDGTSSDEEDESIKFLMACINSAGMSQNQLFERRYLTRIWIVQELLLPKRALFPLGDSDIICDREQSKNFMLRTERELDLTIPEVTGSLSELLKATSHCHASDPRDRVYGLLGLFRPQDISSELIPDYSLSWRDCWVGTAAYLLLVEMDLRLLAHAMGNIRPTHWPSWVPDIESARSWFVDLASTVLYQEPRVSKDGTTSEKMETIASGNWATEFVMYSMDYRDLQEHRLDASEWWGQESHRLVQSGVFSTESLESASVNSCDGALQLQAIRVFDGSCRLSIETEENELTSIWVRGPSAAAHFRILGPKRFLTLDESCQLFVISCQGLDPISDSARHRSQPYEPVLLALTTVVPDKGISVVTLHDCCMVYDVYFYSMDHLEIKSEWKGTLTNELHSLHWVLECLQPVPIGSFRGPLSEDWIFACMFPSPNATTHDILRLLICLSETDRLSEESPGLSDLIYAAADAICPDFDPVVRDNHFYLSIKDETMFSTWSGRPHPDSHEGLELHMTWGERVGVAYSHSHAQDQAKWTDLYFRDVKEWREFWRETEFPVTIRFSFEFLLSQIKLTRSYTAMRFAREFSKLFNEELEILLSRTPRPEDRCVFFEGWGQSLAKELGLVWRAERITIV